MSLRAIADKRTSKIIGATIAMQVAFIFAPAMAAPGSGEASYLIERLLDSDAQTQRDAVHDLEEMGRTAVPSLISAATGKDRVLRHRAIEILGRLGKDAQDAVPHLIDALRDSEPQIRRNAAWALGRVGSGARSALPALLVTANDGEWDVRADAVWAVGKVTSREQNADAVDALITALDDPSHHVRWSAAWSAARIGSAAEAAVPALIDLLEDPNWKLRASAASALARIAVPDNADLIISHLSQVIDDRNRLVRVRAAATLKILRSRNTPGS